MATKGIYLETFKLFLQELKKHYLLKTSACLQKAYLCNDVKKLNKLSIKNTTAWLCDVSSMLVHFPVPGNNLMVEDELRAIIYHMVKYDWHNDLHKSSRMTTDLSLQYLVYYFEQVELLNGVKQKAENVVADNNSNKKKNQVVI
eukprot:1920362-Ditylum_brightwellii.AAC.1